MERLHNFYLATWMVRSDGNMRMRRRTARLAGHSHNFVSAASKGMNLLDKLPIEMVSSEIEVIGTVRLSPGLFPSVLCKVLWNIPCISQL